MAACCFTDAGGFTGGRAVAPLRAIKRAGAAEAAGADCLALLPLAVFAFPATAGLLLGAGAALLPLAFPFPERWGRYVVKVGIWYVFPAPDASFVWSGFDMMLGVAHKRHDTMVHRSSWYASVLIQIRSD